MRYLLFIIILFTVIAWAMGFVGYNAGIVVPILAALAIMVAILRAIIIKRKNSY
jgi:hypothetical protein